MNATQRAQAICEITQEKRLDRARDELAEMGVEPGESSALDAARARALDDDFCGHFIKGALIAAFDNMTDRQALLLTRGIFQRDDDSEYEFARIGYAAFIKAREQYAEMTEHEGESDVR